MTDSTDHVTGKTGLALTITASKDGGSFGAIAPAVTERGSGWYSLALTGAMTDTLGDLGLHITASGADPADPLFQVVADLSGVVATNNDKTGYALTAGERTAIATAVEASILNEGDATALLAAIAAKVEEFLINEGDSRATLAAIAAAVCTALGYSTADLSDRLDQLFLNVDTTVANSEAAKVRVELALPPNDPGQNGGLPILVPVNNGGGDVYQALQGAGDSVWRSHDDPSGWPVASIGRKFWDQAASIKSKTDGLPTDPADASDVAASFAELAAVLAAIQAQTNLITAQGVTAWTPLSATNPSPLDLTDKDDYVDDVMRSISFNAVDFLEFPADSVKLAISCKGVRLLTIDCETAVLDAQTQSVRFEILKSQIAALPQGSAVDYRFWCHYGTDQDVSIRWGVVQIAKLAA